MILSAKHEYFALWFSSYRVVRLSKNHICYIMYHFFKIIVIIYNMFFILASKYLLLAIIDEPPVMFSKYYNYDQNVISAMYSNRHIILNNWRFNNFKNIGIKWYSHWEHHALKLSIHLLNHFFIWMVIETFWDNILLFRMKA